MIVVLSGGVGGARLVQGLASTLSPNDLTVIVNTGDDEEFYGLHVSPDIDIVLYHIARIVDEQKGWGIRGDTFNFVNMMLGLGVEAWFKIGDRDLAVSVCRTQMLASGLSLTQVTRRIAKSLSVSVRVLPMTNHMVRTRVHTRRGILSFQEYFVRRGARDKVVGLEFEGAKRALPSPEVEGALRSAAAIIIAPSNPLLSIGPMLAIKKLRRALMSTDALVLGISPIICGKAVKGPAAKVMRGLGFEGSALGVAKMYKELLDVFIIDKSDEPLAPSIERLGIPCFVMDTMMNSSRRRTTLAQQIAALVGEP